MSEGSTDEAARQSRFLLDGSLGRLARNLRMFGLDAEWADLPLRELVGRALKEGRWVLTRRAEAEEPRPWPVPVVRIQDDRAEIQVVQVLRLLPTPVDPSSWFWRCLRCNQWLDDVSREAAMSQVPDHVARSHERFRRCPSCGRVYWPGSHKERMLRNVERWARQAWGTWSVERVHDGWGTEKAPQNGHSRKGVGRGTDLPDPGGLGLGA